MPDTMLDLGKQYWDITLFPSGAKGLVWKSEQRAGNYHAVIQCSPGGVCSEPEQWQACAATCRRGITGGVHFRFCPCCLRGWSEEDGGDDS